jgi:hypothetical protein
MQVHAMKNFAFLALILAITTLSAGCSSMGVEPWDRDILAKAEMQLTTDPLEAATDDHIYFSKEASSGGRGFGGGGCGCN